MSPPKKSRVSKKQSDMLLFTDLENQNAVQKIQEYVFQVIEKLFPDLENPRAAAVEIASEISKLKLKTISVHLVSGFIKNRIAEKKPGISSEGYLLPVLKDNALTVLKRRYLKKDKNSLPAERPYQMFRRVAETIAKADIAYGASKKDVAAVTDRFYEVMVKKYFIPNSPTLMNAGRSLGQLSACFVLPIEDSMDSIFESVKHTALIHKSGGGTGFSFSKLRPTKDEVHSTAGVSSGPISFISVFDAATETIKQGGTRRGANMAILRVDHPNILDFITCKSELNKLNNFNLSVGVSDDFMTALKKNGKYNLINPRTKKKTGSLFAKKVFEMIVRMAWSNGEPGMVFLDRINAHNPTPGIGDIEATNPCGEQPLLPYESCNLGSINLALMVAQGKIDFDLIKETVRTAVHFLDNVIDVNKYPLDEIRDQTLANRKIGLGIMGWADMLIQLGIPYNSKKALNLVEKLMSFLREEAFSVSCDLAKARGEFPNIDQSIYKNNPKSQRPRNATVTTIAPTGTISIIAGASSGIEPIFAVSFYRRVLDGDKLVEINPYFELMAKKEGFYSDELMETIAKTGSISEIQDVPASFKKLFVTSHDIQPEWHIKMQAAFQKHTDNAVSKTVNFPEEASVEEVAKVFQLAYDAGCKGVTAYRYGSRDSVLKFGGKAKEGITTGDVPKASPIVYNQIEPRARAKSRLTGTTELVQIGCGKLYITVNSDQHGICELFTTTGRTGGCPSQSEATSRMVSLALRSGIKFEAIIEQLKGIRCHSAIRRNDSGRLKKNNGIKAVSCPAAIADALEICFKNKTTANDQSPIVPEPFEWSGKEELFVLPEAGGTPEENQYLDQDICPDCGANIQYAGGCVVCVSCGYSRCG